jgi:GTP-binding protein EngB required for normal cell division
MTRRMDLHQYEKSKFAIAEILRSASACVPEKADDLRLRLQDLFARLAEDRFNVVVVGRFNRGKSSLMNAILASNRLPTGIVPLTSVITSVGYGSKERVVLKYENRILDSEITIEALASHITQQGNPGNVQRIKNAEIQLPAEILRHGFYFVDTPGLGSVIVENTLTTEGFLPEADAFILVTSYESPLSEDELQFFKAGSASDKRIFIVLNKHDTVSPEQREAVISFVQHHLEMIFDHPTPPIFSVSSTDGLKAKLSTDQNLLEASGIPRLEEHLLSFLLTEKSSEFLLRMCDRAHHFLRELPQTAEIGGFIARIDALPGRMDVTNRGVSPQTVSMPSARFRDLHGLPSCEICASAAEKLWKFLCKYQYEIIIDQEEQKRFAKRGGLCPFHTWQLQSVSSPYGLCAGYAPLLDRLAGALRNSALGSHRSDVFYAQLQNLLPDERDCVLCSERNAAERGAIDATAEQLEHDRTRALNSLSAICFPHFVDLVSAIRNDDLAREMLQRQATVLERYAEDMKRFAIKHAGVRRHLASEEEINAANRALLLIAGRREINLASRKRTAHGVKQSVHETVRF